MNPKASIVAKLKEAGYNNRMVSISCKHSTVTATIRDASVSYLKIQSIVEQHESISRCEVSGEILLGGNTYTEVLVSDEVAKVWVAENLIELNEMLPKIKALQPGQGLGMKNGFVFWKDNHDFTISNGYDFRAWTNEHESSLRSVALSMYIYSQKKVDATAGEAAPAFVDFTQNQA